MDFYIKWYFRRVWWLWHGRGWLCQRLHDVLTSVWKSVFACIRVFETVLHHSTVYVENACLSCFSWSQEVFLLHLANFNICTIWIQHFCPSYKYRLAVTGTDGVLLLTTSSCQVSVLTTVLHVLYILYMTVVGKNWYLARTGRMPVVFHKHSLFSIVFLCLIR